MFRTSPMTAAAAAALLVAAVLALPVAQADHHENAGDVLTFHVDPVHSDVSFKVRHLVSKVRGEFNDVTGTVTWDPADPKTMQVTATIATASIDTDNERRDGHLKSEDFFHVEEYPEIRFESTGAEVVDENRVKLHGELTMRGVTKPTTLDVEILGVGPGMQPGEKRAGFEARGEIDRTEFGVQWNRAIEGGGTVLSDEVEIVLQVEAVHRAETGEEG